jgi:hypothetical protein
MTTPHKQPSCPHVTIVTVNGPHQIYYEGQTYLDGDTVVDVLKTTAAEWIDHGWAEDISGGTDTKSPAKTTAKK